MEQEIIQWVTVNYYCSSCLILFGASRLQQSHKHHSHCWPLEPAFTSPFTSMDRCIKVIKSSYFAGQTRLHGCSVNISKYENTPLQNTIWWGFFFCWVIFVWFLLVVFLFVVCVSVFVLVKSYWVWDEWNTKVWQFELFVCCATTLGRNWATFLARSHLLWPKSLKRWERCHCAETMPIFNLCKDWVQAQQHISRVWACLEASGLGETCS